MQTLKYTALGILTQVIIFVVVGLVGDLFFYGVNPIGKMLNIYTPVFSLVEYLLVDNSVHGDARMIGPVIIGIPMSLKWKATWYLFALQFLIGVVVIASGFAGAISEKFIFETYFTIYEPLMFLGRVAGFMAVFFLLPVAMFVYSYLAGLVISLIWKRMSE